MPYGNAAPNPFLKGKPQRADLIFHRSDGSFHESVGLRFSHWGDLWDRGLLSRCNYAFNKVKDCRFLVGAEDDFLLAKSGDVPDNVLNGPLESSTLRFDHISKYRFAVTIFHDQDGQGLVAI